MNWTQRIKSRLPAVSLQTTLGLAGLVALLAGANPTLAATTLTTVAGSPPNYGYSGDLGPATSATLDMPTDVAVSSSGSGSFLYIADSLNNAIRQVNLSDSTISTLSAAGLKLNGPRGVATDANGDIIIANSGENCIEMVPANGTAVSVMAGVYGVSGSPTDGTLATAAKLKDPTAVAVDNHTGGLIIADTGNSRIEFVPTKSGTYYGQAMTAGDIYTVAGNGTASYSGENGPATAAELNQPESVTVDPDGNIYIADTGNNRVREVWDAASADGNFQAGYIYLLAGNGTPAYIGDGGPATSAELDQPQGVLLDYAGNLLISDSFSYVVRSVDPTTGLISTVAGTNATSTSTRPEMINPAGLATTFNSSGAPVVYVADSYGQSVQSFTESLPSTGTQVSGVSFAASPDTAYASNAKWTVGFSTSATGALTVGQAVYVTTPTGTVLPSSAADYSLNGTPVGTVQVSNGSLVQIQTPVDVANGAPVAISIDGVTNPSDGNYATNNFEVWTDADLSSTNPANGINFVAGTAQLSGVTLAVSPNTADVPNAKWTVDFTTSPTGALSVGQAVYLTAPIGTAFPSPPTDYWVNDVQVTSVTASGANAQITVPVTVNNSATVAVTVYGVTNPAVGDYAATAFAVHTDADTAPVYPSGGVSFAPGPATQLAWTTQPGGASSGSSLSPPPVLSLEDVNGNVETGDSTSTVDLALTTPGGATLSGTNPVTLQSGVATFTDLSVDKVGSYTLTPTSSIPGISSLASSSFVITAGPAAQVQVSVSPSTLPADNSTAATVTAGVYDANGNPVSGVSVTFSTTFGNLGPNNPVLTDASGQATDTVTSDVGGKGTVTATATGFSSILSKGAPVTFQWTAPSVTGLSAGSGQAYGGSPITITGTGFTGATAVDFGGVASPYYQVDSYTQITTAVPAGSGLVDVVVYSPGGTSAISAADQFGYTPDVWGVYPPIGNATANNQVQIAGDGFTGATAVDFGPTPATSFKVNADTGITATAPAGSNTVDVTVKTPGGTSAKNSWDQFSYNPVVQELNTSVGSPAGNTLVELWGYNLTGATAVDFGSTPATNVQVLSDSEITCSSPAGSGLVDITVQTPGGTSATNSSDQFNYGPVALNVSPNAGSKAGGTSVDIWGYNLTAATAVYFGSNAATSYTVNSDNGITAVAPAGDGSVDVVVYGPGGQSAPTYFNYVVEGNITGQLTNQDGSPVANAWVQVQSTTGNYSQSQQSDSTGHYTFQDLPDDTYTISAIPNDTGTELKAPAQAVVTGSNTTTAPVLVFIPPAPLPTGVSLQSTVGTYGGGQHPTIYWESPSTLTVTGCPQGSGKWSLTAVNTQTDKQEVKSGPMSEDPYGSGTYVGTIPPLYPMHGDFSIEVTINCPDGEVHTYPFDGYIDPSGTVETPAGVPIVGATVYLQDSDSFGGPFVNVPNGSTIMSTANRDNPVITGQNGQFAWDVLPGYYRIEASAPGYSGPYTDTVAGATYAETQVLTIPPPVTGLVLYLTPNLKPKALTATTTTLTSSANPAYLGANVLLTATVSPNPGGGTVTFYDNGTKLGSALVDPATGVATYTATDLTVGTHPLTAAFSGTGSDAKSSSAALGLAVKAAPNPALTGVSPASGSSTGGTTVTITGTNLSGATTVDFGATAATDVQVLSDTMLTATSPSGNGTVDVTVTTAVGQSATGAADKYTYTTTGGGGGGGGGGGSLTTATSVQGNIGTFGGSLATADNSFAVQIPGGAFSQAVTMSVNAVPPAQTAPAPSSSFVAASLQWSLSAGGVEPSTSVQATFHYDSKALNGLSPNRLGVYYLNTTNNTWSWIGGKVNPGAGTVTAILPHFSTYAVFANTSSFQDLGQAAWAETSVDTLLGARILDGISPGVFDPNGTLTRAQFTKLLVLAAGLSPQASSISSFQDVANEAWYAPYVAAAVKAGLVQGTSATTFAPDGPITREQIAVMLERLLGGTSPAGNPVSFSDSSSIASWALSGVQTAVQAGLIQGFPDGSFQPSGTATRAQAAEVVAKYLKHVGKV